MKIVHYSTTPDLLRGRREYVAVSSLSLQSRGRESRPSPSDAALFRLLYRLRRSAPQSADFDAAPHRAQPVQCHRARTP